MGVVGFSVGHPAQFILKSGILFKFFFSGHPFDL
jgi:hypothetical protein